MRKESKCKKTLIDDFRFKITLSLIVCLFSLYEAAPVYIRELQCLAILLKPAECEKIVSHSLSGSPEGKNFLNTTQCFQSLLYWALNTKLRPKDAYLLLKNRLRQIGRTDLISLVENCAIRFRRELSDDTIDDWGLNGDEKETTRKLMSIPSSTLSKIDKLLFGLPRLEPISGSSNNAKDLRPPSGLGSTVKLLMNVSPRIKSKLHPFVKERANEIDHPYSTSPESSPFLRFNSIPREDEEKIYLDVNHTKREKDEEEENEQQDESEFHNPFLDKAGLHSSNKTLSEYPCLRLNPHVVLGIVGFIAFFTCCCTLCIRRKIVRCFNLCRPKKKKKKSSGKYISIDSESGQSKKKKSFSFKSLNKKSNDPSKILINTATQDSQASILKVEDELSSTGCCQCCKKKNKKSKKRKK